jgi:hypothetical protein
LGDFLREGAIAESATYGMNNAELGTMGDSSRVFAHGGIGRAGLHAIAGCAGSAAGGGKCGSGALSAGFAEFAGPRFDSIGAPAIVSRMFVGGIAAELGGGKFANGAMTAAFGYLFNECAPTRMCGSWQGYGPKSDEHYYVNVTKLAGDCSGSNCADLIDLWSNYSAPGWKLNPVPFVEGGSRDVFVPPLHVAALFNMPEHHIFRLGQITQSSLADGGIRNTTGPGFHMGCCGEVNRWLVQSGADLYSVTIGIGTNLGGVLGRRFNEFAGPITFRRLDSQLCKAAGRSC